MKLQLERNTVLHREYIEGQKFGTLYQYQTGTRAYLNQDMLEVLEHILAGKTAASFVPLSISAVIRSSILQRIAEELRKLELESFITRDEKNTGGLVKDVSVDPPLRVLFIETTKTCNLRCKHCYVEEDMSETRRRMLSGEDILNLLQQADELGVMEIQLTGGETFLIHDMMSVLRYARKRLVPCSIFTNGTVRHEEILNYVREGSYGLIFYVSLDGPEIIHDEFRQCQGAYQKTTTLIRQLVDMGCDVRLNTTVGSHNIEILTEFAQFIKSEFGILHRFVPLEELGRAKGKPQLGIADVDFARTMSLIEGKMEFLDVHDHLSSLDWETPACGVGSSMLFVNAYGDVSLCPTLTRNQGHELHAGNIISESLKSIWEESGTFKKFRNTQCRRIYTCKVKEICRGGCRCRSYLETGDMTAPDSCMCRVFSQSA